MDDVVALGTTRDRGDLDAGTTERRQRFGEFEFFARERAAQYLRMTPITTP